METKICVFEENPITFALEKNNGMMINATEMAKPFGKNVGHFMENDSTKNFIRACLNNRNSLFRHQFGERFGQPPAKKWHMDAPHLSTQVCGMAVPRF